MYAERIENYIKLHKSGFELRKSIDAFDKVNKVFDK